MSAVAGILGIDSTQKSFVALGTITLTGNYGTSGGAYPHGDLLDLSQLGVESNELPYRVEIFEMSPAGALSSGNTYQYMPGTTQANGQIQIRAAGGAEITPGGAYGAPPFAITGFALYFRAFFSSFTA